MTTFTDFAAHLEGASPVVLLEGTRAISAADFAFLEAFAARLAARFPDAIFRSGNATGSDEAFARGVAKTDGSRLQLVVPYSSHRESSRPRGAQILSLQQVADKSELERLSLEATPSYEWLASQKNTPKLRAKWDYLLRDTLKITGLESAGFAPAKVGLFFVDESKKAGSGGTGHTLRVCEKRGVPTAIQSLWRDWKWDLNWDLEI